MTPPKDPSTPKEQQKNNYPVVVDIATRNSGARHGFASGAGRDSRPLGRRLGSCGGSRICGGGLSVGLFLPHADARGQCHDRRERDAGEFQENSVMNSLMRPLCDMVRGPELSCLRHRAGSDARDSGKVPYPLWDLDDRHPCPSQPRGIAGWSRNDERVLVYDRHDIWSLDPRERRTRYVSPTARAAEETSVLNTPIPIRRSTASSATAT